MTRHSAAPELTVIVQRGTNPTLRSWCLSGFSRQTTSARRFEVVLPRAGESAVASRLRALRKARGAIVLFWSTDWQPFPELVDCCLRFHHRHTRDDEALRAHAVPHVALRNLPFARWQMARGTLLGEPGHEGVHAWTAFRGPGLSVRRALFEMAGFEPRFGSAADLELGARLSEMVPLKVWFERIPLATVRPIGTFARGWADAYHDGYDRRLRLLSSPRAQTVEDLDDCFVHAERHARSDAETSAFLTAVPQMEATLGETELSFPEPPEQERLTRLFEMYDSAVRAARARGWIDAGEGRPEHVPGTSVSARGDAALRRA